MTEQIEWEKRGRMTLCEKGNPSFPTIETTSGLYKLTLDSGWIYFGEATNLRNRLACYIPGNTGLAQETRLHVALKEAKGADVEVFISGDLTKKTVRCELETAAVRAARAQGLKVLNAAQKHDPYCILLDIKFHERQIEVLRNRLAKLTPGNDSETTNTPL